MRSVDDTVKGRPGEAWPEDVATPLAEVMTRVRARRGKLVISTEVPSPGSVGAPSIDSNSSACRHGRMTPLAGCRPR